MNISELIKKIVNYFPLRKGEEVPTLTEWMQKTAEEKRRYGQSESNACTIVSCLRHLENYGGSNIPLGDINKEYCEGFIKYLTSEASKGSNGDVNDKRLKRNTARLYYDAFVMVITEAEKYGFIVKNTALSISRKMAELIRKEDSSRSFLTKSELGDLSSTRCPNETVKRAFLFGCFCGLRISDIRSLTWVWYR